MLKSGGLLQVLGLYENEPLPLYSEKIMGKRLIGSYLDASRRPEGSARTLELLATDQIQFAKMITPPLPLHRSGSSLRSALQSVGRDDGGIVDVGQLTQETTMSRTVERLFRAPYGVPNALQVVEEGLWITDQITDRVALIEIAEPSEYGVTRLIRDIPSESSNTSGMAWGGGSLWLAANGAGTLWRPARPTDAEEGEIFEVDPDYWRDPQSLSSARWGRGAWDGVRSV